MKKLLTFLLLPLQVFAQDITGIWTGYIQTTETNLPYEIVISENKGKLGGYSLTVFTFNGVENIGIKSMKFKNKNEKISIEDDELLYNNFSSPPRKVKLLGELILKTEGSTIILSGSFYTRSLDFRATNQNLFTGTIYLQKQDNETQSKLTARLDEMNLLSSLSFVAVKKKGEAVTSVPVEEFEIPALKEKQKAIASPQSMATVSPPIWKPQVKQLTVPPAIAVEEFEMPALKEREKRIAASQPVIVKTSPPVLQPQLKEVPPPSIIYIASAEPEPKPEPKVLEKNVGIAQKKTAPTTIQPDRSEQKKIVTQPTPSPATTTVAATPVSVNAAADLAKRKTEIIRSVPFTSDSLVLSLYDNGTVDGDTVSVVLNGKVIIAKKGLTTNAIRTTIQITPDLGDSLQLVMYAENLGSIPPNTGLLIIQDGDVRNEIRFAGDMQKSSAIILRRKQ
jgi:hypothetical protein